MDSAAGPRARAANIVLVRSAARSRPTLYEHAGMRYALDTTTRRNSEVGTRFGKVAFSRALGRSLGGRGLIRSTRRPRGRSVRGFQAVHGDGDHAAQLRATVAADMRVRADKSLHSARERFRAPPNSGRCSVPPKRTALQLRRLETARRARPGCLRQLQRRAGQLTRHTDNLVVIGGALGHPSGQTRAGSARATPAGSRHADRQLRDQCPKCDLPGWPRRGRVFSYS